MIKRKDFVKTRNYLSALTIDLLIGFPFKFNNLMKNLIMGKNQIKIKNILVIKLDHIGDVLLMTPALGAIRKLYPEAHISCLIGNWAKEVLSRNRSIDEIILWDAPWHIRDSKKKWQCAELFRLIKNLRSKKYDLSLHFRADIRNLAIGYLVGAKRRVGYGRKGGGFFLTDNVPYPRQIHVIDEMLDVPAFLGAPKVNKKLDFSFSLEDENYAQALLGENSINPGKYPIIAINPFAGFPIKNLSLDKTEKLADILIKRYGAQIIFTGTSEYSCQLKAIELSLKKGSCLSLAGKTNLKQLAALLSMVDLLITVDSAPWHIASVVQIPVVILYSGRGSLTYWGPYQDKQYIIHNNLKCNPCYEQFSCPLGYKNCIESINLEEIVKQVDIVLARHVGRYTCKKHDEIC